MSGLEAISFLFIPLAAAILSYTERCGFPDEEEEEGSSIRNYTYGPQEACPEVICSSSSSDSSIDSGFLYFMTPQSKGNTLLSLNSSSYNDDFEYRIDGRPLMREQYLPSARELPPRCFGKAS
jgi:hypothetical protein